MVKLDKSKKLPYKTYFFYFYSLTGQLIKLMENSNETDYSLHDFDEMQKRVPKSKQIEELIYYKDAPNFVTNDPCFCISNYPPKYLFEKLEELRASKEEIEIGYRLSEFARKYRQD